MGTRIQISRSYAGMPKQGFVGALVGGTEPGLDEAVELETDLTGIAAITLVNRARDAFIAAFNDHTIPTVDDIDTTDQEI